MGGGRCGEFGEIVGRCAHCCELGGGTLVPVEGVVVVMQGARSPVVVLAREGDGGVQGGCRGWLMWALLLWVIDVRAGGR